MQSDETKVYTIIKSTAKDSHQIYCSTITKPIALKVNN